MSINQLYHGMTDDMIQRIRRQIENRLKRHPDLVLAVARFLKMELSEIIK